MKRRYTVVENFDDSPVCIVFLVLILITLQDKIKRVVWIELKYPALFKLLESTNIMVIVNDEEGNQVEGKASG